jgi:uncharacterized protein YciI
MRFIVIAHDGTDPEAKDRRAAVRPAHLERIAPHVESGRVLLGGAMLDEAGDMVGSVVLADFPSREEFDAWIAGDPYVTGGVWQQIEVRPYRPAVGAWFPGE